MRPPRHRSTPLAPPSKRPHYTLAATGSSTHNLMAIC